MHSWAVHLHPWFDWLLRTTWQAGVLVGLILLLQKILGQRLGVRGRYGLWLILLIRLALPWTLQSPVSVYNVLPSSPLRGHKVSATAATAAFASTETHPGNWVSRPAGSAGPAPLIEAPPARRGLWPRLQTRITLGLLLVWLAGAAYLAGSILVSYVCLRRLVRQGRPVTDRWVLDLLEECKQRLRVRADVRVLIVERIGSPALLGILRPHLLLPQEALVEIDPAELRHILVHELAHLKRHDILVGHVMSLLHVLHWFNPLIALGFRRMRADRELACDGLALSVLAPGEAVAYGHTIVHQIERSCATCPRWRLAALSGDKARVRERIDMISRCHQGSYRRSALATLLVGGLACVGLTEGSAAPATWDKYARGDFPTTHQDEHVNIIRISIRHIQTDRFLVARDDEVFCDAVEPGAAGLWEARFDEDLGGGLEQVVYFYSVATGKYLAWDEQGNVAATALEPTETARWAAWNMGGAGTRIVPYPFAHFYLRVMEGQVKTPSGTDPGMFWDISQVWRIKTSDNPKSSPQWRREHVPGPD